MARPEQELIETFMNITGASETIAVQKLEEHGRDLNRAINAHFNGDRNIIHPSRLALDNDLMVIDDQIQEEPLRSSQPQLPASHLDQRFGSSDGGGTVEVSGHGATSSNPTGAREAPEGWKDNNEDFSNPQGLQVNGNVVIDDGVVEDLPTASAVAGCQNVRARRQLETTQVNNMTDNGDDIEEEMIRAAIEASKHEVEGGHTNHLFDPPEGFIGPQLVQESSHSDDVEFARAVSLSLKTAEKEKALREKHGVVGTTEQGVSSAEGDSLRLASDGGRQGFGLSVMESSRQFVEEGRSSIQEEAEDEDEQPLVRHRSERLSSRAAFGAAESVEEGGEEMVDSLPSNPVPHDIANHPQPNRDAFHSDEWGGISSEEHDEAVMLEAAMFGGIPEGTAYHRLAYPLRDALQTGLDEGQSLHPQGLLHPPSPSLVAQRLLREQQDDEYLAALRADKEKELKAREEAEIRRVKEAAAREAFLEEERQREEEARRKLLEEEEIEKRLLEIEASLPPEPNAEDESAITLLVRMPDGSRRGRRFLKLDKLQSLFDFIDIGRVVKPSTYKLVRPYPRQAFGNRDSGLTLSDLGLTSKQEALFLELI